MKKAMFSPIAALAVLMLGLPASLFVACSNGDTPAMQARIDSLQTELKKITDENASLEKNLATFDVLDFDVFSNQKWDRLGESHGKDIIVNWPDGHHTNGIEKHIEDLKAMFVYAPDITIKVHPIRFGAGEWTCATGIMTGTFSKPMPVGGGKFIKPTGKSFSLTMCTVGHWKEGIMTEESLFWDNQTFMKQLGLAK